MAFVSCGECGRQISNMAEICPDCGYPVAIGTADAGESAGDHAVLKEYRLMQLVGAGVTATGIAAAVADSPIASVVALIVGLGILAGGLLGARYHRRRHK